MTRLPYTEKRFQVLCRINSGLVMWHDDCEPHAPGFSWLQSDMSLAFQELCTEALHARLVELGHHEPWGSAVSLSDTGVARLAEWREQRALGLRGVA